MLYTGVVQIAASPGLLDDLAAASEDASAYHHDLCQSFMDPADFGLPAGTDLACTCGAPALLRRLAAISASMRAGSNRAANSNGARGPDSSGMKS